MNLTITPREFARLDEARHLQVERYRTAFYRQAGELPRDDDPNCSRRWLRVLLAGQDRCVPVGLLTQWANTFDDAQPLSLALSVMPGSCADGLLTISRGTSRLRVPTVSTQIEGGKGYAYLGGIMELPEAIPLIPEGDTIRLDLPDIAAELAALARETTGNRKTVAKAKAIKRTTKAEKAALDTLTRATEDAAAAQAVIDGQTLPEAIAYARRCLAARRVFRDSLAALETRPAWLPATYAGEAWDAETATHTPCTHDTAEQWAELVALYVAARTECETYKPRQGGRVAHWRPNKRKAATKGDKLAEAEKRARSDLAFFLGARYREHLATLGLPDSLALADACAWSVLHGVQTYSRARLLLRTWPARCAELTSLHAEAVAAREAAEAREV